MTAVAFAELRRMLRRRGLILASLLVPLVVALGIVVVRIVLHRSDAVAHPVTGGTALLDLSVITMMLSMVFGTVIGAIFGAEDIANGTLRYILLTGFPRLRLYLVRIPVVAVVAIGVAVPAVAVLVVAAYVLPHPGEAAPSADALWSVLKSLLVEVGVYALIAYGIGVAIRSTGGAIAVALGLNLIGVSLLGALTLLVPGIEPWLLGTAIARITAGGTSSILVALVATAVWTAAFLALGLVRALRTEA